MRCIALLVCDGVGKGPGGKMMLVGPFDVVRGVAPAHVNCVVYAKVEAGVGEHKLAVVLRQEGEILGEGVSRIGVRLDVKEAPFGDVTMEMVVGPVAVTFKVAGRYVVELVERGVVDGVEIDKRVLQKAHLDVTGQPVLHIAGGNGNLVRQLQGKV